MGTNTYTHNKDRQKRKFLTFTIVGVLLAISVIAWGFHEYSTWKNGELPATASDNGTLADTAADILGITCEPLPEENYWKKTDGNRNWFLKGSQFSESEQTLKFIATADEDTYGSNFSYTIRKTNISGTLVADGDGRYHASVDTSQLEPGTYKIVAIAQNRCSKQVSNPYVFKVSYPVYVTWTIDWEGSDVKQEYLNDMAGIADKYEMPMTHYFNPRIYATNAISEERADYLTEWVIDRRDLKGETIALHLHMFPDMVAAAGITPQTSPAWGWSRTDGYDIMVSGYSYDDMTTILDWSVDQFEQNGLGTPQSFRAGGWFADETTLQALNDAGFKYDTSGRTNFTIGTNNAVSPWYLSPTTQPYQPNKYNQNSSVAPNLDLWELPNNGGDSWAFSRKEMYERYTQNYSGGVAKDNIAVTYLSHPDWFNVDKPKMDGLLGDISKDLYKNDTGPVIFVTLDEVYNVWTSE